MVYSRPRWETFVPEICPNTESLQFQLQKIALAIAKFISLFPIGYLLVSSPTDRIVKEGTTFQLECTFSSLPNLLTWIFNATNPIPQSNSSTLTIIASAETAGYYHCEAFYEFGSLVSSPALIQIGC